MPPAPPAWQGQQGMGQPTATHPQGPQGLYLNHGSRGEGNLLFPPLPPCGKGCKRVGYRLRPIRKASRASMGYPPLRAR
jgi:hypothetical protein